MVHASAVQHEACHSMQVGVACSMVNSGRLLAGQVAVEAGADSDKYPPGWLFHQKWAAGRGKGPAPTLDGHRIEVAKVAGRVCPARHSTLERECGLGIRDAARRSYAVLHASLSQLL